MSSTQCSRCFSCRVKLTPDELQTYKFTCNKTECQNKAKCDGCGVTLKESSARHNTKTCPDCFTEKQRKANIKNQRRTHQKRKLEKSMYSEKADQHPRQLPFSINEPEASGVNWRMSEYSTGDNEDDENNYDIECDNDDNDESGNSDDNWQGHDADDKDANSTTHFDSNIVGTLDPWCGISSAVEKFVWENSTGISDYLDALLKLQQEKRTEQNFQNDQQRKKKAFKNEEKRRQDLHEQLLKNETHVEVEIQGQPALVSRMKSLLEISLIDNMLVTKCPVGGCNSTVSPFSFAVVGETLDSLDVRCIQCARQSKMKLRRELVMDKPRALTWLMCAGDNRKTTCAVCEGRPIDLIWDQWQRGHVNAKACCGDKHQINMFPCHGFCNREQHTRSLSEIRKCTSMSDTPFPHRMSEQDAEMFLDNLK